MFSSARRAYDQGARTSASSRALEASALSRAARLLDDCRQGWNSPERPAALTEALRHNQRLWTLFQAELDQPDHPLPPDIRRNLLRLSAFVDRRTLEILADPRPDKLDVLIEINRTLAAGLQAEAA
jgi:flagellar protein FlaF